MTDPLGDLIAEHVHSEVRRLVSGDDTPCTPDGPDVPDTDAP